MACVTKFFLLLFLNKFLWNDIVRHTTAVAIFVCAIREYVHRWCVLYLFTYYCNIMSASYFKSKTFKSTAIGAVSWSFHNAYLMMLLPFCYCGLSLPRNNKLRNTQICHTPNLIFAKRSSSCHCTHIHN